MEAQSGFAVLCVTLPAFVAVLVLIALLVTSSARAKARAAEARIAEARAAEAMAKAGMTSDSTTPTPASTPPPIDSERARLLSIIRERYARGEINRQQYDELILDLHL